MLKSVSTFEILNIKFKTSSNKQITMRLGIYTLVCVCVCIYIYIHIHKGVSEGMVNILGSYIHKGVSEGMVNILGSCSMEYSE